FVGQRYYALDAFAWPRLAALFLNGLLLQLALYALTLLASAFGREGGKAALVGVLIAVLSFLLNALAALWSKAAFLTPWAVHGYLERRQVLVNGDLAASSVAVLAGCAVVATAAAFARFARRDLP